jgi:curli biogenesis system outer membrane secretion channel CsgG
MAVAGAPERVNNEHFAEVPAMKHLRVGLAALILGGLAAAGTASAQPTWGSESSASPNVGSSTSQKANEAADRTIYRPIEYTNASKQGPALVVIPGEIKSNNATFVQKFSSNNIADFAEIELSKANFQVLERTNLGPLLNEFQLAYNLGDPNQARRYLGMGKLRTTKYVVKFDILKTEQVAAAQQGFDGRPLGQIAGILGAFSGSRGGAMAGAAGGTAVGSVQTGESTGVWVIGMRYKIMNAETTEQVAQGYTEEKMEVGATSTSVLGVSQAQQGGVTLDTMVQRLIQKTVWEIDNKYK